MANSDAKAVGEALDALAADNYTQAAGWKQAHQIAQAHEGEPVFDRLHALCHRIEGDAGNARYWYSRAGIDPFEGEFSEEAEAIRRTVD